MNFGITFVMITGNVIILIVPANSMKYLPEPYIIKRSYITLIDCYSVAIKVTETNKVALRFLGVNASEIKKALEYKKV